jgi:NhaP-type Na+/H+ or K+/H+ antiporter/Trk K+ transport system NAD-binding subunit
MAESALLPFLIAVAIIGVVAQTLSDQFRVPSVIFLIIAGIIVGPEGIGLDPSAVFGDSLITIVGLFVAIIVFEGAFNLDIENVRSSPTPTIRLVTIGTIVSVIGSAIAVFVVLDTAWGVALLIGALVLATGPTVISPILSVVRVRDRVAATLDAEGTVNDVTAAVLAVAIWEAITLEKTDLTAFVDEFLTRLLIGIAIGVFVAVILYFSLRYVQRVSADAPHHVRLLVLAGIIVAHGSAETITGEAGIVAAVTAGLLLGNAQVPYEDLIADFEHDIIPLVLAFVFLTLASLFDLNNFRTLGVAGLVVVALIMFVVRPLVVFLSTTDGSLSRDEQLYMSLVAPRGIVAAGVATLFALQIQMSNPQAATNIAGTVFLVILVTVVFEAGFARHLSEWLGVTVSHILVVGGGKVGLAFAHQHESKGEIVEIVESDPASVDIARTAGFTAYHDDGTDPDSLRRAGIASAKRLLVVTNDDDTNLQIIRLAREKFGVKTILARVNDPANRAEYLDLGVDTLPTSHVEAWAIDQLIAQPSPAWLLGLIQEGGVHEVEVTAPDLVGRSLHDLQSTLPPRLFIASIGRDGKNHFPTDQERVQAGDYLTFIGENTAVKKAVDRCRGS